jgi:hypothetical protein
MDEGNQNQLVSTGDERTMTSQAQHNHQEQEINKALEMEERQLLMCHEALESHEEDAFRDRILNQARNESIFTKVGKKRGSSSNHLRSSAKMETKSSSNNNSNNNNNVLSPSRLWSQEKKKSKKRDKKRHSTKQPQPYPVDPHEGADVFCGRDIGINGKKPGNIAFRHLIEKTRARYEATERTRKVKISEQVVQEIRRRKGRFLEPDLSHHGQWIDIGDKRAINKCSQAFRDLRQKPLNSPRKVGKLQAHNRGTRKRARSEPQYSDSRKLLLEDDESEAKSISSENSSVIASLHALTKQTKKSRKSDEQTSHDTEEAVDEHGHRPTLDYSTIEAAKSPGTNRPSLWNVSDFY